MKALVAALLIGFLMSPSLGVADEPPMTNQSVLDLQQLQFGDEVIIEKIKSSTCSFDTSTEALKTLKAAGISGAVMAEMIRASNRGPAPASAASVAAAPSNPNDPLTPHEPGIYYLNEETQPPAMVQIEPTVYTASRSGGFLKSALTYGIAKVKTKAVLSGPAAKTQIQTRRPTFYFYFEPPGAAGSGLPYFSAASSASEFLLTRTETKKKNRELVVGEFNAFSAEGGVQEESIVPFDYEKIGPGVYKVSPKGDLIKGEYCFFYGGSAPAAGSGKVFDFGMPMSIQDEAKRLAAKKQQ